MEDRSNIQATKEDITNLKADLVKWLIVTKIVFAALIICFLQ